MGSPAVYPSSLDWCSRSDPHCASIRPPSFIIEKSSFPESTSVSEAFFPQCFIFFLLFEDPSRSASKLEQKHWSML